MKLREVDPLEPQPGDRVRISTPFYMEDPDHPMNWDEGTVLTNAHDYMVIRTSSEPRIFRHDQDEYYQSIYYIVEEA